MMMTQQDFQKLVGQINDAFKGQFDKLSSLEQRIEELENAKGKGNVRKSSGKAS